ncbi:hypothetical protein R3P38DRAFT_3349846 [Favolaschia claudopus]|uniref:Uncharacterized protein n=1 Tax=Favolaschia claudopus TaxID=2862362 RepID=A0AAW0CMQ5_9AGAR
MPLPLLYNHTRIKVATYVLGGWDIGICADLFFQGILYTQFIHYTKICKRDSPWLKLFVAGLAFLTTLKSIQAMLNAMATDVIKFEDLASASVLWRTHWLFHLTVIGSALLLFYVQLFFCVPSLGNVSEHLYRFCRLSPVRCGSRGRVCCGGDFDSGARLLAVHLGTAFLGDLILTVGLYLSPFVQLNRSDPTLIWILVCRPRRMVALINFIAATRINVTNERIRVELMLCEISNMVLPQLYAMSAMWTLNSREDIRAEAEGASELDTFSLVPAPPPADAAWSANDSIHETSPGPSLDILDEKSPRLGDRLADP